MNRGPTHEDLLAEYDSYIERKEDDELERAFDAAEQENGDFAEEPRDEPDYEFDMDDEDWDDYCDQDEGDYQKE